MNSYIEKLSKSDNFPTDAKGNVWLSRDEDGNIHSDTDTVKVATVPAFLFGHFMRERGLEYANEQAEAAGEIQPHDFGACVIKEKSLRKEADGRWYLDLMPENPRVQKVRVLIAKRDDAGNVIRDENGAPVPLLDDKGNVQTDFINKKESFITVTADMVIAEGDEYSVAYKQGLSAFDRKRVARSKAAAKDAEKSERKAKGQKSRGTRKVISASDYAAVLSGLE